MGGLISEAARPVYKIETFNTFAVMNEDQRNDHVRRNVRKTAKRLSPSAAHAEKVILACFGPSLRETWGQIALDGARGAKVVTVSGAHQFLIERSVVPYAHIDCDPRGYKADQMGAPVEGVKYWIASCVDPAFIDKLLPFDLTLWHLWNGDVSAPVLDEIEPGSWALCGGSCVGLRAISLLYVLGYRRFEIHGMDCSHAGVTHALPHVGKYQAEIDVRAGDRWFKTTAALASYAREFFEICALFKDAEFSLHGDGLLQHMARLGAAAETN